MANNQLTTKINKIDADETTNIASNLLNKAQAPSENLEQNNKMSVVVFIFLLVCAGLLDLIDIIQFTGIGVAISVAASLLIGLVFNVSLFIACQKSNMKLATKLATTLGNYIIELIPGIDVLPINMIAVIICYVLSNPETTQKIAKVSSVSKTASRVIALTSQVAPQIKPLTISASQINQSPSTSFPVLDNNQQILSKPEIVSLKINKV